MRATMAADDNPYPMRALAAQLRHDEAALLRLVKSRDLAIPDTMGLVGRGSCRADGPSLEPAEQTSARSRLRPQWAPWLHPELPEEQERRLLDSR